MTTRWLVLTTMAALLCTMVQGGQQRCLDSLDGTVPLQSKRASKLERHVTPEHGDVCRRADTNGFFCPSKCNHLKNAPWCAETVCGHFLPCTVRRKDLLPVNDIDGSNCTLSRRQRDYLKHQRVKNRKEVRLKSTSVVTSSTPGIIEEERENLLRWDDRDMSREKKVAARRQERRAARGATGMIDR